MPRLSVSDELRRTILNDCFLLSSIRKSITLDHGETSVLQGFWRPTSAHHFLHSGLCRFGGIGRVMGAAMMWAEGDEEARHEHVKRHGA